MNTENLIAINDYLKGQCICGDCHEDVLESIELADAMIVVDGTQYIDFTIYDSYYSDFLNELKEKAQKTGSLDDAYDYVCSSADLFDSRYEFINSLSIAYSKKDQKQANELKRHYEITASGYRDFAEHVVDAHELLFKSKTVPDASSDTTDFKSEGSVKN